jgi:hypothetical protein
VYSQVAAVVEPKRAKLKEAQAELEVTEHLLKEKQAALKIVSDRVAALEASFALTLQEQEDLKSQVIHFISSFEPQHGCLFSCVVTSALPPMHHVSVTRHQVSMCETKLIRAEKLISGLL